MKTICKFFLFAAVLVSLQQADAQYWRLAGNGSDAAGAKLGSLTGYPYPVNFITNGVQRATITELGRVGIGIASPINILTVKASGGIPSSSWTNVSTQIFYGFSEDDNGEFNIGTATNVATRRSLIQGRRARGTLAAPAAVQNNDYLASIIGSGYDGSAFQNPCEVDFYADGAPSSGHVPGRISFVTGTNISDRLERLKIGSTGNITVNNNQLFVQASSGNVGIGTTSPNYKLSVIAGSTNGIYASTSGIYGVTGSSTNTSGFGTYGTGGYIGSYGYGGTYGVYGATSTTATTSYGVNGSGYRGVNGTGTYGVYGTGTFGVYGLGSTDGVVGTGDFSGVYGISSTSSGYGIYGYSTNNIGTYGYGKNYGVQGVANPSTFGGNGVYGQGYNGVYGDGTRGVFGTSSVTNGVAVYGTSSGTGNAMGVFANSLNSYGLYAATGVSGGVAAYFVGSISINGTVHTSSDAKLKKNVTSLDNAMDVINRLQPKNYEFRNDGNYALMNLPLGKHYGFIAQELEKVLPDLVKQSKFNTALARGGAVAPAPLTPENEGKPAKPVALQPVKEVKDEIIDYKGVNYIELIPIMVKGMQEQDKKIISQQQQIEELKQIISKLTGNSANASLTKTTGTVITDAALGQNTPNPFTGSTSIAYTLPQQFVTAQISVTDMNGKMIKQVNVSGSGKGNMVLDTRTLSTGSYQYSLFIDGQLVGTKQMLLAK